MTILVTGGAGYIGSHVLRALRIDGAAVVVVDDLSTGSAARLDGATLIQADLSDPAVTPTLAATMSEHGVDAIIHLAAAKRVDESVAHPEDYYRRNVGGLANLLAAARRARVGRVVFSSSAAVYASSDAPVAEDDVTMPANPYGETKLVGEWLLRDFAQATGGRAMSLRYFNAAGCASPELAPSTADNLIPIVCERLVADMAPVIFGDDYETPDGTCVRDFVHPSDLADAHVTALAALDSQNEPHRMINLGSGSGASVREVVDALISISGRAVTPAIESRRTGDPAMVVADISRARSDLGWTPRIRLDGILRSAWDAAQR